MGVLIVIEGLDGSGKNTLAGTLTARWRGEGRRVATLAFPRYGANIHADLVRDALYGRLGDLTDSVYGSALLFALDRRDAADQIRDLVRDHDVVLLDRYVSSNAAYGSARLGGPEEDTDFPDFVRELEIGRFGIPIPDRQVLLATPADAGRGPCHGDVPRSRRTGRWTPSSPTTGLQRRTAAMYAALAAPEYLSPWTVLTPDADGSVTVPDLLG